MWKVVQGLGCPVCRSGEATVARHVRPSVSPPWLLLQQRAVSTQRQRKPPSRMVLSPTVANPSLGARGREGKPTRRRYEGPFAGMNRTVANVRPDSHGGNTRRPERTARQGSQLDAMEGRGGGGGPGGPRGRERRAEGEGNTPEKSPRADPARPAKRPFKALRMQQSLATIGYGQRAHIKARMQDVAAFDQLPLLPSLQTAVLAEALGGLVDVKPTPIQRLAIPALLGLGRRRGQGGDGRQDFLLAAETGSGKTLAYLLPVLDAMKRAEAADPDIQAYAKRLAAEKARRAERPHLLNKPLEPHPTTARPRVLVLVPSAELVDQVGGVVKALSHVVKFRAERLSANLAPRVLERNLYAPTGVDVVVATPLLLASMAETDPNVLSRVTHLVIDEADSLLDRSFAPATMAILDRARPSLQQLIFCSATIPRRLDGLLAAQFPDMQRITTPNLHAIPRRVQLGVLDVAKEPYRNNKNLACADAIWSIGRKQADAEDAAAVQHIMVFVNEREKTQEVAAFLRSKGIDAVALHRDATEYRQGHMLAEFTTAEAETKPETKTETSKDTPPSSRTLANTKVIVATDLASRGIDTVAVRHVVLYDVPHTTIDFIHRLGRAGRMGRRGRGIVLVGKEDRRDIVAEVRESMFMGQALV